MGFQTKAMLGGRQKVRDPNYIEFSYIFLELFPPQYKYMSALGGHFVTVALCPAVSLYALPPAQDPTLCLIHGRHTINATLIEFDLFEFYIYPIICFHMPFANVA